MLELIITGIPSAKIGNIGRILFEISLQAEQQQNGPNYNAKICLKTDLVLTAAKAEKYKDFLMMLGYKPNGAWTSRNESYFVLQTKLAKKAHLNYGRPPYTINYFELSDVVNTLTL
jgi:hypothetical protein